MSDIPILALTANVMQEQQSQYLEAGLNGVVAKPIEPRQLAAAIRALNLPARRALAATATAP